MEWHIFICMFAISKYLRYSCIQNTYLITWSMQISEDLWRQLLFYGEFLTTTATFKKADNKKWCWMLWCNLINTNRSLYRAAIKIKSWIVMNGLKLCVYKIQFTFHCYSRKLRWLKNHESLLFIDTKIKK